MEKLNLYSLDERYNKLYPKDDMIAVTTSNGIKKYSSAEFVEISNKLASALIELGVEKQDKICIVSPNRPEWSLLDMSISKVGAINAPIYPNITREEYKYIINDCGAKLVFVGSNDIYQNVKGLVEEIDCLDEIISFDNLKNLRNFNDLIDLGSKKNNKQKIFEIQNSINEEDLFTLIYTSGTTGNPKGVMLSHKNVLSQVKAVKNLLPVGINDRAISFLPLCHVFERMVEYFYMYTGVSIYYSRGIDYIGDDLKIIKPTIMPTVPRLLEKVYDKILTKGNELKGLKRLLFFWAVNLGLNHKYNKKNGLLYELQLSIANKLIFNKWREAVGGRMRFIFSGASALQERIAKIFTAAQMPVLEGYGLSETSPVISVNLAHTNDACYGTVGTLIDGVELKLIHEDGMKDGEGEIVVKGPNIMMGYFNKADETKKVLTNDGWFHTGDIGRLVDDKYLKITDRKKEIFKTSGGKYIAPQVMENKFKESRLIEQIIVIGEGEKHTAALIVPSIEGLNFWCNKHKINIKEITEIIKNDKVLKKFDNEVEQFNGFFNPYERIKVFRLLSSPWSVDGGELTATMKLRRKNIIKKYSKQYNEIYR